jgi:hypothetical protein
MIKEINFDMDGVLVDISKELARLDGYDDPVHWFFNKREEDGEHLYPISIGRHIDRLCFETCQPMPFYDEMKKLINYLYSKGYKINILSSCIDCEHSEKITKQKINWLYKYYGEEMKFINAVNIVRGSKLKINYIGDNAILIDDYIKTHRRFIENGMGDQFIFYKNFEDCVNQLIEKNII